MKTSLTLTIMLLVANLSFGQYTSKDSTGVAYFNFNSLDNSISCDSINSLITKYGSLDKIPDQEVRMFAIIGQIKCSVTMLNDLAAAIGDTTTQYQAQVLFTEDDQHNPKVLFNLIDLKSLTTAKEYAKVLTNFAPVLLAGATGPVGEVLLETGIATALGKYSVEAYYESAIKNDPLIILYPTIIPAKQFTNDVIKELKNNNIYNEATKVWEKPVDAILNPISKMGTSTAKVIVGGAQQCGQKAEDAIQKLVKHIPKVKIKW